MTVPAITKTMNGADHFLLNVNFNRLLFLCLWFVHDLNVLRTNVQSYRASHFVGIVVLQEPEDLPAQWGFQWSTDPKKALPFIALSTSPYAKDDCCTHDGHVWRSGQDNNVWAPGTAGAKWNDLGEIEEVMEAG